MSTSWKEASHSFGTLPALVAAAQLPISRQQHRYSRRRRLSSGFRGPGWFDALKRKDSRSVLSATTERIFSPPPARDDMYNFAMDTVYMYYVYTICSIKRRRTDCAHIHTTHYSSISVRQSSHRAGAVDRAIVARDARPLPSHTLLVVSESSSGFAAVTTPCHTSSTLGRSSPESYLKRETPIS